MRMMQAGSPGRRYRSPGLIVLCAAQKSIRGIDFNSEAEPQGSCAQEENKDGPGRKVLAI